MTQHENLAMMDTVTTKYGRTTFVTISRTLSIILIVIFFICLIATGLLVYSFTSGCSKNTSAIAIEEPVSAKSVLECAPHSENSEKLSTVAFTTSRSPETTAKEKFIVVPKDDQEIRLPRSIKPVSYKLSLIPFLQENNFTFHGKVSILVNILEDCTNITLHAMNLTIETVSVMDAENKTISIKDVKPNEEKEQLVIELTDTVIKGGQYVVFIVFKGVLNDMLYGFYRSSYVENNVTRWIAATQFESTEARKAFPCFDEPALKAKFQISIARLKNMTSISNMRIVKTSESVDNLPDYVWDHYEESLPMSTYLVAFVVSDFKKISNGNFSLWARASAISQAQYGVNIGPGILKFYEKFFGIDYPLPKLDMVAIPDFSSGAMENWGLVTYREAVLLYEKGVSNKLSKQSIAHVMAHELAHQWFGNLVTMEWWDDLWLNEGFATYVEFLGADAVQPKWKEMDRFVVTELHESLELDALKSSHPISVKVNKPSEVDEMFDSISYAKGASIIRMMRLFLGENLFQKALSRYLRERMYSNAKQDDLWNTLTLQTRETENQTQNKVLPDNVSVKEIMDTWTLQTGFPVVSTQKQPDGSLILTQERFSLDKGSMYNDKSSWWIPITFVDSQGNSRNTWIKNVQSAKLDKAVNEDLWWYIININQTGYYRVNYELENWKHLTKQLLGNGHRAFTATNRAQMIDDSFSLAFGQYLTYEVPLNISLYLINEREYVPWKAATENLQFLHDMFVRSGHFDKFKVYATTLFQDIYYEVGFKEFPNEDPLTNLKRTEIVRLACLIGFSDCVLKSVQQFQNWKNSPNPDIENTITPDLKQTVYCTAIGDGGQEEWEFAWQRYHKANVANDKETLLVALACSKETWILSRFLEWSITDNSGIRKHDTAAVFASVTRNPIGQDLAYRFFKTNWERIIKYLGSGSLALSSIVNSCTNHFNTEEEVNDFKSFFWRKKEEFGTSLRTAKQAIEHGEAQTRWMKQNSEFIVNWLNTFNKNRYIP